MQALQLAQQVPSAQIAEQAQAQGLSGPRIGELLRRARIAAMTQIAPN
jgi:hypothetical protein